MSDTSIKHLFTRNPWISPLTRKGLGVLNACMRWNSFQTRSKRIRELKYLNIGCGKKMIDHTINLNYEWYPRIDLTWDVIKTRLPFKDGQLSDIYTEHVFEHLPPSQIPGLLSELRRCLQPGGVLRVLVPDAELYLRTYCQIKDGGDTKFPDHMEDATPMDHVNRVFRSYEHLYAYDFETLGKLLEQAGFIDAQKCGHKEGRVQELLLDSDEREDESLRIECVAP